VNKGIADTAVMVAWLGRALVHCLSILSLW